MLYNERSQFYIALTCPDDGYYCMEINRYLDFRHRHQLVLDLIVWIFWSWTLLFTGDVIKARFSSTLPYVINSPEPIRITIFFLFLVVLIILTKDFFQFILVSIRKNKTYIFSINDWPDKWIFNGKTELINNTYLFVKSSRAGSVLKDYFWKNFRMSFEMKFLPDNFRNQKLIGIIFRAKDLDNYFMIEIGEDAVGYKTLDSNGIESGNPILVSSIKPHVRYKGGWEIMSIEEIVPKFDFSTFKNVVFEVKGSEARLFYNGDLVFYWVLPTHVDVNHIEAGVKEEIEERKNITIKAFAEHVQDIPFRLNYGLVGFRGHVKHGAIIRNLRIDPI